MCGILCHIGRSGGLSSICKEKLQSLLDIELQSSWETSDETIIQKLIDCDLQSTLELSTVDKRKIANLDEIRSLNLKLNKVKNTIGKSEEHAKSLLAEKQRIDDLIQQLSIVEETANEPMAHDTQQDSVSSNELMLLISVIATRGPNFVKYTKFPVLPDVEVQQFSSILSLRQPLCSQPIEINIEGEDLGLSMQFNGELYNKECLNSNDTKYIAERLIANCRHYERHEAITRTIGELYGEFAYVIIDKKFKKCYFGRDFVGKRSLLYAKLSATDIIISSVSLASADIDYVECKSETIYTYNIGTEGEAVETIPLIPISDDEDIYRQYKQINNELLGLENQQKIQERLQGFEKVFYEACKVRIETIHPIHADPNSTHLGILFSGGLDCTVIAGTIGKILSKATSDHSYFVDLLTVGFDNPRTQVSASDSPDRILAKKSWSELASMFNKGSRVEFRLVEVNVAYEEWLRHKDRVKRLMYPCDTEMDLSIAIAFYFASRGKGDLIRLVDGEEQRQSSYLSSAKVLLSGLGADELFAGYLRHERILNNAGPNAEMKHWKEMGQELTEDIKRIYIRNLGRDDRVIALWGKELRYPFLDERVINYITQEIELDLKLSVLWETVTNKKGKSSTRMNSIRKWILREYAELIGLLWVKNELKRAIQFGAKSAKMEIGQNKTKGTDQL